MGIEPTCAAWEAAILPLNHARMRETGLWSISVRAALKGGGVTRENTLYYICLYLVKSPSLKAADKGIF